MTKKSHGRQMRDQMQKDEAAAPAGAFNPSRCYIELMDLYASNLGALQAAGASLIPVGNETILQYFVKVQKINIVREHVTIIRQGIEKAKVALDAVRVKHQHINHPVYDPTLILQTPPMFEEYVKIMTDYYTDVSASMSILAPIVDEARLQIGREYEIERVRQYEAAQAAYLDPHVVSDVDYKEKPTV